MPLIQISVASPSGDSAFDSYDNFLFFAEGLWLQTRRCPHPPVVSPLLTAYKKRPVVKRFINLLKDTLGVANQKTSNVLTAKADPFLVGIVQLLCVLLAHSLHDMNFAQKLRCLIASNPVFMLL